METKHESAELPTSNDVDWEEAVFQDFASSDEFDDSDVDTGEMQLVASGRTVEAIARLIHADKVPERGQLRIAPPAIGRIANPDILEAYLLDATRGVMAMERGVIAFESQCEPDVAVTQICRELHTLKGASAIAGLEDLARYLHEVEELVQEKEGVSRPHLTETMFACVDVLRTQVDALSRCDHSGPEDLRGSSLSRIESHTEANAITVKASQLDRLMDMLAELVMLRNQRESRVDQLREINEELGRCGSRLRELESHFATLKHFVADEISHSNPLLEVANDIGEIGRTIRDSFEPVAAENIAVSSFIWQFREALVSLLRMPVTGLFQRLQRASLDAARVEGKQVRFVLKGAESGLERSLQERLFEPLLHIVRNAVSHGIETPRDRVRAGKDSVGTVTLEASNTPEMLVLTVRDDGRGLDYEALRIRGVEMKILAPDQPVCPKELARLIFHSGFSTRKAANEVAGRGIGMDVVASVLERMQSLVEVESTPGQGTTVRMSVPLRSNIEYAMVFRSADQLLAVPMPYVKNAGTQKPVSENKPRTIRRSLRGLLGQSIGGLEAAESSSISFNSQPKMTSGNRPDGAGSTSDTQSVHDCIELVVDEIIGPEEVVVRPLPPLLRHQQLFAGVTLSGGGHVVLVLDPTRLVSFSKIAYSTNSGRVTTAREKKGAILVVDDSLSSRRHMASMLQRRGWKTVEASDGISALDRLVPNAFDAVFTDFEMPRMDGLQLIHSIRTQTRFSDLPIVMISSLTPMAMREKAMKEGANYYVQKPASGDALEDILDRLVTFRSKPNE